MATGHIIMKRLETVCGLLKIPSRAGGRKLPVPVLEYTHILSDTRKRWTISERLLISDSNKQLGPLVYSMASTIPMFPNKKDSATLGDKIQSCDEYNRFTIPIYNH